MNINDRLYIIKKTLFKNKKDFIQIFIFTFLILLILSSITAFYSYKKFGNTMLRDSINAHELSIYGLEDDSDEIENIKKIKEITTIKKEYEVYTRAYANSKVVDFYSIPKDVDFVLEKITSLKEGEMIVSNELELEIGKEILKGKKLIGQTIQISLEETNITEIKIVDVIDSTKYGYGISKDSAFISDKDMLKIADTQKELLDEYTSVGDVHVALINNIEDVDKVYNQIKDMGISINYMVSADTKMIQKIYTNIFILFFISVFLFFSVKILYLYNYLNKDKKNIVIFLTSGYSYKDVFNIYALKNLICSIFSIILSTILYFGCIVIYNNLMQELVAVGLKVVIPLFLLLIVWILEVILNIIIIKLHFKKIEKLEISEYARYD